MERVCVLGAGTMGRGIAYQAAIAGCSVRLRDVDAEQLAAAETYLDEMLATGVERGLVADADAVRSRVTFTTELATAADAADIVIEAVPETLELKRTVLSEAETHLSETAIRATNTSSLPITSIAAGLAAPARTVGLHFFNPVHAMDLVEIVTAEQTSRDTRERAESFVRGLDKTGVTVTDSPGFATSRLGAIQGVEAIRMLASGTADARAIDSAMELGYGHPTGPLELTDLVGLDVRLDILDHLREELGERFAPPPLLRRKVRADKLGKKAGEGFYEWDDGEIVGVSGGVR